MSGNSGRFAYRTAAAIALAAGFLQIWIRMVGSEESPDNLAFFGVVATAAACAFTARFRAEAMGRAMLATAGVQALLGLAVATAPINAPEAMRLIAMSGSFTAVWLVSAALFHRSGQADPRSATA